VRCAGAAAAALAAAAAALATAPAALADTFRVSGTSDAPAACAGTICPTLRSAVTSANALPGADAIVFDPALGAATITVNATLSVTDNVTIDGGGDITVAQAPAAAGPLLDVAAGGANGSAIQSITLAGPGAGTAPATSLVSASASNVRVASSTLRDAATSAVSIRNNAQRVRVTRNSIFGYGTKAVSFDSPGVNGGIAPPASLRVGPRRADGTLPVTGSTATAGTIELFRGAHQSFFLDGGVPGGGFSFTPSTEPAAGEPVSATLTDGAGDTSEYASTRVPDDVASPSLAGAVATGFDTITVQASEPIDPASVQPADFVVQMASVTRTITSASVTAGGTRIVLVSDKPWEAGEAGTIHLTAPGAITDTAGNASLADPGRHVGGAPADLIAPVITSFRLNPRRGVCFVLGPHCKRDRTAIIFRSSEDGDTYVTVLRGRKLIGERRYTGQPGANYIRFDGKIEGRRLRPGLYRMYAAMQDEVGNRTPVDRQPHVTFRVKRTHR
jgi:hypothetical protein